MSDIVVVSEARSLGFRVRKKATKGKETTEETKSRREEGSSHDPNTTEGKRNDPNIRIVSSGPSTQPLPLCESSLTVKSRIRAAKYHTAAPAGVVVWGGFQSVPL